MAQTNLGSLGTLDWGEWALGLVSAFVSGGAQAAVAGATVTLSNPGQDLSILPTIGATFVLGGILNLLAFLYKRPRPEYKTVVVTTRTTGAPGHSSALESLAGPSGVEITRVETFLEPLKQKE